VKDAFRERYAAAFSEYVGTRGEDALRAAYELGREAVREELGVLDLASIHHEVLLQALVAAPSDVERTTRAAEEFFFESLSAFEIVWRGYGEAQATAALEQRNTAILRQLSTFLADASLAVDAHESLAEMLQLVCEHAREMLDVDSCTVRLADGAEACSHSDVQGEPTRLLVRLTSLDGRELGSVEVAREQREFSAHDEAILTHLAQMASAAIERVRLYAM
jgi:Phosphoserine phosphatase RsbU, N-terminal domain